MFANAIHNFQPVWLRIGQGPDAPLVPGIISDARVGPRSVIRSQAKGGAFEITNSVVVISLRENLNSGNGRPATYMTERPEALIALSPRATLIPAIDGTTKMTQQEVITALREQVAASLAALTPAPASEQIEAEAARYLKLPALTAAK